MMGAQWKASSRWFVAHPTKKNRVESIKAVATRFINFLLSSSEPIPQHFGGLGYHLFP